MNNAHTTPYEQSTGYLAPLVPAQPRTSLPMHKSVPAKTASVRFAQIIGNVPIINVVHKPDSEIELKTPPDKYKVMGLAGGTEYKYQHIY